MVTARCVAACVQRWSCLSFGPWSAAQLDSEAFFDATIALPARPPPLPDPSVAQLPSTAGAASGTLRWCRPSLLRRAERVRVQLSPLRAGDPATAERTRSMSVEDVDLYRRLAALMLRGRAVERGARVLATDGRTLFQVQAATLPAATGPSSVMPEQELFLVDERTAIEVDTGPSSAPPPSTAAATTSRSPPPLSQPPLALVGGLAEARRSLEEVLLASTRYSQFFDAAGIEPPRGIMLFCAAVALFSRVVHCVGASRPVAEGSARCGKNGAGSRRFEEGTAFSYRRRCVADEDAM
jgi:hypothetical protein